MEIVGYFTIALTLANGFVLLCLQAAAYRRHHHQSFLLLTLSTITALVSVVVMLIPQFVPAARSSFLEISIAGAVLYAIYAVLGIWGVVSLFRSYGALRQGA